ncbi:uncharacterized protein LOC141858250 [Brevipalpus obovatus]|uniref:uncharacterized protein LOC141858250 n=1 Tax=Brevipalpus obovatus TaxID=246614 RepID=UPI003D9E7796
MVQQVLFIFFGLSIFFEKVICFLNADETYKLCGNIRGLIQFGVSDEAVLDSLFSVNPKLVELTTKKMVPLSRQAGGNNQAGLPQRDQRVVNQLPVQMYIKHKHKGKKKAQTLKTTAIAAGQSRVTGFGSYIGFQSGVKSDKSNIDLSRLQVSVTVGRRRRSISSTSKTPSIASFARDFNNFGNMDSSMIKRICGL